MSLNQCTGDLGDCQVLVGNICLLPDACCCRSVLLSPYMKTFFSFCYLYTLPLILISIKSFLTDVVQLSSFLGWFLRGREKIAIGKNLKRYFLLWEKKQHQAVAG